MRFFNLEGINVTRVFDVLIDDLKIRLLRYFVSDDSNAKRIGLYIVN